MAVIIASNTEMQRVVAQKSGYTYFISAVVALGGLLFGYDLVIISGTVPFFKQYYVLNEYSTGWAVGCLNIGAALGSLIAGKLSDLFGRKKILLFSAFLFAVTGIGTGWADNFNVFIAFRMLSGVAVGTAALVCPMYIAEVSPAQIRGKLVAYYQLAIVSGLLLAYLANYLLLNTGENNWRWMFSSQAVPALLFFFALFFVTESPRWLIAKQQYREADKVLNKIGGEQYAIVIAEDIRNSFAQTTKESLKDLFQPKIKHILFLGVMVAVFSQIDGQNSLFSYAPEIFNLSGISQRSSFLQSIILGLINFIFTFVAIIIIDKAGRKKLLEYGSVLLSIDAIFLAMAFWLHLPAIFILLFVLCFIAIYGATLGPVTWVMVSEIFPNRVRGNAMSAATVALWLANFITTASFPVLKEHIGLPFTFLLSSVICFIYFIFIRTKLPETKGKSLEEIEQMLTQNRQY
jgi:MFS transporter, SP family, arabinose:H+ symporter